MEDKENFDIYFGHNFHEIVTGLAERSANILITEARRHVAEPAQCRVCDLGCGFGNSTAIAYLNGFTNIEGIDELDEQLELRRLYHRDNRGKLEKELARNALTSKYPAKVREQFLERLHGDQAEYLRLLTGPESGRIKLTHGNAVKPPERFLAQPADVVIGNLFFDQLASWVHVAIALEDVAPLVKSGGIVAFSLHQSSLELEDLARDEDLWNQGVYGQRFSQKAQEQMFVLINGTLEQIPRMGVKRALYSEEEIRAGSSSLEFLSLTPPVLIESWVSLPDTMRGLLRNGFGSDFDYEGTALFVDHAIARATTQVSEEELRVPARFFPAFVTYRKR